MAVLQHEFICFRIGCEILLLWYCVGTGENAGEVLGVLAGYFIQL